MKRWQMELKKIEERKGFILVDAMVAVLVLAIGLSALALLYTGGIGTLHKSNTREKAVQVAAERLELLKAKEGVTTNLSTLQTLETDANTDTNKKVTLDGETYTTNLVIDTKNLRNQDGATNTRDGDAYLYPVTVTVTWNNPNPGSITLTSYVVAKSGT